MGGEEARERVRRNVRRTMRLHEPPLNPAELARRSGADVKTIRAFLSGERWPHGDTLDKIVAGLGLEPDAIDEWVRGGGEVVSIVPTVAQRAPTIDEASIVELARALLARIEALDVAQ